MSSEKRLLDLSSLIQIFRSELSETQTFLCPLKNLTGLAMLMKSAL